MQPLVSVLISIYNPDPLFLAEQIKSIDTQTYSNIEIVVYNDNPDDASRETELKTLAPSRIVKYYHGEKNLGYIKAFEKLVGLASGEYIALCDQDDIWNPNRVERGITELEKGYVLAVCDRSIIDAKGTVIDPSYRHSHPHERECNWNSGDDITAQAAFSCYAIGMATMVRKDVAVRLAPFPQGSGHDLWIAAGASAIGVGSCINKMDSTLSMMATIRNLVEIAEKNTQHVLELV